MEVIRTPDPDPFVDKWHPAIGHVKKDDKHKIECEVCHRYLKTSVLRVEHVKTFHPTVFYDCVFCPGAVFYTIRDLISHCKKNHFVCHQCDSAHNDQNSLKRHMVTKHPEQPAQAGSEEGARKGYVCGRCGMYCSTAATFRVHLTTHKKTPCPFCPQKFYDAASRNKHVSVKHSDRGDRELNCRLAPNCRQTFNNIKELGIHSRQAHWKMFPFRCNYKDCFDCYRTIDALVKHCRSHGKETWDATHSTEDKKDRYKCSLCPETFDQVAQLLSHTQVHEENKYKCDECEWHFYLIAGLTCHGQDCHDTRYHACSWCVEYFDNADALHTHIRRKHHFECTICYDVSPTAEDLEEHIREKHGGLQPSEQELQTHRHREERLEQSERRKEKAEAEARQTKYFPCRMCVEGFDTKRELDKHITDKHIFVCGECLKTFKTKEERDTHMKTDHKDVSTKMTKQEKLLAEEYRKRESREEKDRRATETWKKVWTQYAAKKEWRAAEERKRKPSATQTKEEAERAKGDDRDEDEDYVPSEEPSSEDPPYEPTKKELKRADKEGDQ